MVGQGKKSGEQSEDVKAPRLYRARCEDTVVVQGLRLARRTRAKLLEARGLTGWSMRAVLSAILDTWADGRLWSPPPRPVLALGGLAVALLVASSWSSFTCAHHHEPAAVQVAQSEQGDDPHPEHPMPEETFATGTELDQQQGRPVRKAIPLTPAPFQKTPPCDPLMGEKAINGACYVLVGDMKPPRCGRLLEHGDACYRAVAKAKEMPVSVEPDRPE